MTTDQPRPEAADSRQSLTLNYDGEIARRQWKGCCPEIYQQIRDPGAFFTVLGEVIAQRIDEHADYLAGDDQPGEGYLAKVARAYRRAGIRAGTGARRVPAAPPDQDRPAVVDRSHLSWTEAGAGQRERLGDPPAEEDRS